MNKTIKVIAGICLVLVVGAGCYFLSARDKTAYVQLSKIYNEFELKKELEKKLENVQETRKLLIDSMEIKLKSEFNQIKSMSSGASQEQLANSFEMKRQDYLDKKKMFEEDNAELTKKYDDQIWKQLNQYIEDYGKANGYDYLFGTDGSGSLMYADKGNDITENLQEYVNGRYKGQVK